MLPSDFTNHYRSRVPPVPDLYQPSSEKVYTLCGITYFNLIDSGEFADKITEVNCPLCLLIKLAETHGSEEEEL